MWSTDAAARTRAIAPKLVIPLLALAALSACAGKPPEDPKFLLTPTQKFSVKVEETPDRLAMTPHADGLSPAQRIALISFVSRWRDAAEAGDIAVQVPATGGDPAAVTKTATEVMGALQALGVPSQRVRTGEYDIPAGAAPLVLASYSHLEATGPDCRVNWNNITSTGANEATDHFGCAVTANFAAQVANPRDFLSPEAVTPSDAARRDTVLAKYRRGELTSTPRDEQAVGSISSAVGSK
jgi:pilus assembly protein CpaD